MQTILATTLNVIRSHNPCQEGYATLLRNLGKTKADDEPIVITTILESNGIEDTLWVIGRVLPGDIAKRISIAFAIYCAESVLHIFERKHPDDPRPRDAIQAAKDANAAQTAHYTAIAIAHADADAAIAAIAAIDTINAINAADAADAANAIAIAAANYAAHYAADAAYAAHYTANTAHCAANTAALAARAAERAAHYAAIAAIDTINATVAAARAADAAAAYAAHYAARATYNVDDSATTSTADAAHGAYAAAIAADHSGADTAHVEFLRSLLDEASCPRT